MDQMNLMVSKISKFYNLVKY